MTSKNKNGAIVWGLCMEGYGEVGILLICYEAYDKHEEITRHIRMRHMYYSIMQR